MEKKENTNLERSVTLFESCRAERFFDKVDQYLNTLSFKPFEIPEISKLLYYNDVIIFGAPGTGKSSLLRILCWDTIMRLQKYESKNYYFFKKLLKLDKKKLPFFGFYLNLHKELEKGFYGKNFTKKLWQNIFLYYFCLTIIDYFITNLCRYNESYLNSKIIWETNKLPVWIKKNVTIKDLLKSINSRISQVSKFLNSYETDYKKFNIALVENEFFSKVICNVIDSINPIFTSIFIILDDFSYINIKLMPVILEFIGKRHSRIFFKIGTRLEPILKNWPGMDDRDLTLIDLDYEFLNSKRDIYREITTDIALKRMKSNGINISKNEFENLFETLDPDKEALFYSEKISIKKDNFIKFLKKLKSFKIMSYEDFDDIYDFFSLHDIEPLRRKVIELLTTRDIIEHDYKNINKYKIIEILEKKNKFIKNNPNIYSRLKNISLHLLAIESKRDKVYCGYNTICKLSSYVIQNFLYLLEKLFEEFNFNGGLNKKLKRDILKWNLQSEVIHQLSSRYFGKRLLYRSELGSYIKVFIENLISELEDQFKPQASYEKGKTGFGINIKDYDKVLRNDIISQAVRYSYLQVKNIRKGFKRGYFSPKEYSIFYLNRLILPNFNFLLNYGGYKEFNYKNLSKLIEKSSDLHFEQKTLSEFII